MSGTAVISESIRDSFDGECLSFGHEEETLVVRLHRQPCNEIGTAMLSELEVVAEYLRRGAGGARALLWTSELESGFSAGADLRELFHSLIDRRAREVSVATQQNEVAAFLSRIHRAFEVFDRAPILTVAAVHGVVFGGGLELMLTSDVVVADKSARFGFPELRLGLVPGFGGVPRLNRDLGNAVVRDLLFTGRSLRATRAHAVGLVSQVVARGEAPAVAKRVAEQAARFDRAAMSLAKPFVKPIPEAELAQERDLFVRMFASPTVEKALSEFVSREDPFPYLP